MDAIRAYARAKSAMAHDPYTLPFQLRFMLVRRPKSVWFHVSPAYSVLLTEDGNRFMVVPHRSEWPTPTAPTVPLTELPSEPAVGQAVPSPLCPAVLRGMLRQGSRLVKENHFQSFVHAGSDVPAGGNPRVTRVREDDVALMASLWPYSSPRTEARMRSLIGHQPSACYRGDDGSPVAWCVVIEDGSIAMLHVCESHRRQGCATAVVQEVLRQARGDESLDPPFCYVSRSNPASQGLMLSLGFQPSVAVSWLTSTPHAGVPLTVTALNASTHSPDDPVWAAAADLINRTYRQDDEFFVDQVRTSVEVVQAMAKVGTFQLAFTDALPPAGGGGGGGGGGGHDAATRAGAGSGAGSAHDTGTGPSPPPPSGAVLLALVYVQVADGGGADTSGWCSQLTDFQDCRVGLEPGGVAPGRVADIGMLAVDPAAKRRGLGTSLLVLAESEAVYLACDTARVHVVSVKPWLQAFYAGKGYAVVGREEWPTPDELKQPCHFDVMTRSLVG